MGLTDVLKVFGWQGVIVAVVWGLAYWWLQRRVEASLARRLKVTKHELQLEYQKKSIVFEHQKDSFRRVLVGMHQAVEAIRGGSGPDFRSISERRVDEFKRIVSEESLFMDPQSDRALRVFERAMWGAVHVPEFDVEPGDQEIGRALTQTSFISDRLSVHFRALVGLAVDDTSLSDVDLLGACQLINRHYYARIGFPTEGALAYQPRETASELVAIARQNLDLLGSELGRLRTALNSSEGRARTFFEEGIEVDGYLARLGVLKAVSKAR